MMAYGDSADEAHLRTYGTKRRDPKAGPFTCVVVEHPERYKDGKHTHKVINGNNFYVTSGTESKCLATVEELNTEYAIWLLVKD